MSIVSFARTHHGTHGSEQIGGRAPCARDCDAAEACSYSTPESCGSQAVRAVAFLYSYFANCAATHVDFIRVGSMRVTIQLAADQLTVACPRENAGERECRYYRDLPTCRYVFHRLPVSNWRLRKNGSREQSDEGTKQ